MIPEPACKASAGEELRKGLLTSFALVLPYLNKILTWLPVNSHNAFIQQCPEDEKQVSLCHVLASDFKIVTALIMPYSIMRRDTCIDPLTEEAQWAI